MLTPRLTNCPECADIPNLLKKIDCKLAEYANGLYNNVVFMLNQVVPAGAMIQLLAYKRILTYKQCNADYLADFCMDKIVSKVTTLTLGSNIKPTVTETLIPATTSTTSTSTTCPPLICSFDGTGVSSCSFTGTVHKVTTIPASSTTTTTSSTSTPTSTTTSSSSTSTTSSTSSTSTTSTTSTSSTSTSSTTTTTTTNPCPNCISGTEIPIGTQTWTKCNLDVTTYRDLTPIPQATSDADWANKGSSGIGAWCYYGENTANGPIYGKLYNWYAVNNTVNGGLAPLGYHIPTDSEWTALTDYLGGESLAGGKMKEAGFCHWQSPNTAATNSSGFTGLPGGDRDTGGTFFGIGCHGFWWSTSEDEETGEVWYRYLRCDQSIAIRAAQNKAVGYSVRLIKD